MPNYRRSRINDEVARELGSILLTIKDPRIAKRLVSVTGVDVTPDLKFCKVYFSAVGPKGEDVSKDTTAGLVSATGYIRRELASRLNLRITPELRFIPDDSIKYGAHINDILKTIDLGEEEETDEDGE
ncbi:MAG: 30S ribosome-binding factor RbfA [Clostridia bacterium]|nr:30S ribosome-binding factor RbfA [Clostridia bacterium]MBQ4574003.1 30S ribosome-binding factor RbfA [Clostridia bacterium]